MSQRLARVSAVAALCLVSTFVQATDAPRFFGHKLDVVHGDLVGVMFERSAPVSGPGVVSGLQVVKNSGMLDLTWEGDCGAGVKYGIYRGDLAAGYDSLAPELCNAMGTSVTLPQGPGAADFFLVVPNRGQDEGSYGVDSCAP